MGYFCSGGCIIAVSPKVCNGCLISIFLLCSLIAAGTGNGRLGVYSTSSTNLMGTFVESAHVGMVGCLAFMEEHVLVSAGASGSLKIWDCTRASSCVDEVLSLETRDDISAINVPRGYGEGSVLLTGSKNGFLHIRDLRTNTGEGDRSTKSASGSIVTINTNGSNTIVFGSRMGEVQLHDIRQMRHSIQTFGTNTRNEITSRDTVSSAVIAEDIWDIAIPKQKGKRRAKQARFVYTDHSQNPAHVLGVLSVGFVSPLIVSSICLEGKIRTFDTITGNRLSDMTLNTTPTDACHSESAIYIGDLSGNLQVARIQRSGEYAITHFLNKTHQDAISAVCAMGNSAICSGGVDRNVFVSKISDQTLY